MEKSANSAGLSSADRKAGLGDQQARIWVERLSLTSFRNYDTATLRTDHRPIVLTGTNGAGKTNLLEAVSLFAPGRGLRGSPFADLSKIKAASPWAVSSHVHGRLGPFSIGTGLRPGNPDPDRSGRIVRINGEACKGSGALTEFLHINWLIPAMDGLFTGPASERRRFFDRLMLSFDPGFRKRVAQFERAMRQRNKLLETSDLGSPLFDGLEIQMAEIGVSISAARLEAVRRLNGTIAARRRDNPESPFPWSEIRLQGILEEKLQGAAAIETEDDYLSLLREYRAQDRAARRTLEGPHRTDILVSHGPKKMPAGLCSTGEQKALLVGLVLAHSELVKRMNDGFAPLILLDEIAAHLDQTRREALFEEILRLQLQAWMTGTDRSVFEYLGSNAQYFTVDDGKISNENIELIV